MQITPDYNPVAASRGIELLIMDEVTVDETKSMVVCPPSSIKNHTITLIANAAIAGVGITGAVNLETSNYPLATDEGWSPLGGGAIDLSAIAIPSGQTVGRLQFQFSNIQITAFRGRVSVVVAGGSLSMTYDGN